MSDPTENYDRVFVSIEDGTKPDIEYAPARKVRVELHYILVEDESFDDAFERLGTTASKHVDKLLGRTSVPSSGTGEATVTRTRRTKAQIEADRLAALVAAEEAKDPTALEDAQPGNAATGTDGSSGGEQTASTIEAEDPTELPQSSSTGTSEAADPFLIEPEVPKVETAGQINPISDGDLNSAVQTKNGSLGSPAGTTKIRDLIASYNPDKTQQFQLRQIPADRRVEFLAALEAITL